MTIEMTDGTTLDYPNTSPVTFRALVTSPSPGSFYNRAIRRR